MILWHGLLCPISWHLNSQEVPGLLSHDQEKSSLHQNNPQSWCYVILMKHSRKCLVILRTSKRMPWAETLISASVQHFFSCIRYRNENKGLFCIQMTLNNFSNLGRIVRTQIFNERPLLGAVNIGNMFVTPLFTNIYSARVLRYGTENNGCQVVWILSNWQLKNTQLRPRVGNYSILNTNIYWLLGFLVLLVYCLSRQLVIVTNPELSVDQTRDKRRWFQRNAPLCVYRDKILISNSSRVDKKSMLWRYMSLW